MGIAFDQLAIFEGAWLAFVGIAAQVAGPLVILGQKSPFDAGRETGAATTA